MTEINGDELYLYVFVNLEYDSMGRGRCAAQASHAANQFTDQNIIQPLLNGNTPDKSVMLWREQEGRFGTQIVKAVRNAITLKAILAEAKDKNFICDLVIDPEYVISDGESYHLIQNVVTAGYIFGNKNSLEFLYQYPLLENDQVDRKKQFNF